MASPRAEAQTLTGWRVLVTRPDGVADALCQRLIAAGAAVQHLPLLAIEALPETAATHAAVQDLDRYDIVIVTSRHAVQHAMPWLAARWPQWPARQRWLAVGAATAEALAHWGISAEAPADARSEGLLALPVLAGIAGKRVLLLTGEGGRGLLDRALVERGAQLARLESYRRRPAADAGDALETFRQQASPRRAVLVTSGDALQNLLVQAPGWRGTDIPVVVASTRLAELARAAGLLQVRVADGAGDDALLAALLQFARP